MLSTVNRLNLDSKRQENMKYKVAFSTDLEKMYDWFALHDIEEYDNTLEGFMGWFGDEHCMYEYETGLDKTTFKHSLCSKTLLINLDRIEQLYWCELTDLWDEYGLDYELS